MTDERYKQLNEAALPDLTQQEMEEGWHYCCEWDALLVGPGMGELACCSCFDKNHKVYQTIPKEETDVLDWLKGILE